MSMRIWVPVAASIGVLFASGGAGAVVTIIGNGLAAACSMAARHAADNWPSRSEGERECTLALENETLSGHETAATYVNRGVLHLSDGSVEPARQDFERALRIEPALPEALVDRGAALIAGGRDADGAAEITRGLALNPTEPEKAYYNRGVAEERLGDLKSAYFDYLKASDLKPAWPLPKTELVRFKVTPK